jgi:hypothetical protein
MQGFPFQSGCGSCKASSDYSKDVRQNGGDLMKSNYGIGYNVANGGKPKRGKKLKQSKIAKRSKGIKRSKGMKRKVVKRKSMIKKLSNKVKRLFKGGEATPLPARWYNDKSISKTPTYNTNVISDRYGKYNPVSLGPSANLYPHSPFTSKDPFNMIQDNRIVGGLKKKVVKRQSKVVKRKSKVVKRKSKVVKRKSKVVKRKSKVVKRKSKVVKRSLPKKKR